MLGASSRVGISGVSFQLLEIVKPVLEYSFQGISGQGRGITFGGVTIRLLFRSFAKTTPPKSRGTAALSAVESILIFDLIFYRKI